MSSHRRQHSQSHTPAPASVAPSAPGRSNQDWQDAMLGGSIRTVVDPTPTLSAMPAPASGGHGHSPAVALGHAAGAGYTGVEASHALHGPHHAPSGPSKGDALAPLALMSGLRQLFGSNHAESLPENIADRTAGGLETLSGGIGTLGLAGKLLGWKGAAQLAAKASPIGAVSSAAATGYNLGKSGNRGIQKLGWLGKQSAEYGDPTKNADWSDKAADAGRWARDGLGGGTFGKVVGGATTLLASAPLAVGAAVTGVGNTVVETGQAIGSAGKWAGNTAAQGYGSLVGWPSILDAVEGGVGPLED